MSGRLATTTSAYGESTLNPPDSFAQKWSSSVHKTIGRTLTTVVTTIAAGAGVLSVSAPAFADYDHPACHVTNYLTCTTRPIPAHATGHWIRYKVDGAGYYRVYDDEDGWTFVQGSGGDGKWHTIYGLYGSHYRIFVSAPGGVRSYAEGEMENCTSGCKDY